MFNVSNFYEQSKTLHAQNSFQIALLKLTDATTLLRETSKVGIVVGLVSSASSVVFNFDPTIALTCSLVCVLSYMVTRTCAKCLEPQAEEMIQHFKDWRKDIIPPKESKEYGLTD